MTERRNGADWRPTTRTLWEGVARMGYDRQEELRKQAERIEQAKRQAAQQAERDRWTAAVKRDQERKGKGR
jgi:hypothetical protein